jgi:hypothetical protein
MVAAVTLFGAFSLAFSIKPQAKTGRINRPAQIKS